MHKTLQPFHLNNSDIVHVPVFIISFICIVEFLFMLPDLQHMLSCTILIVGHKTSEAKSLYLKSYSAIDLILITGEPNSWVQILTSSHSSCAQMCISNGLNTALTLNIHLQNTEKLKIEIIHKQRPQSPSATNHQNQTDKWLLIISVSVKKPTSTFLHHLSIISTVRGGDGLSQVMLGNEY